MRMNRIPVQKRFGRALAAAVPPPARASLQDLPALLREIERLTQKSEALANRSTRFERKIHHLVWRDGAGERVCRHCGSGYPEHRPECLAKNITVLKNP